MNSFNPMQAPGVVGNPSFQNQMDALNAAQNVQFQDLQNELDNNQTDLSVYDALGEFSTEFSKLGKQVLKARFEKEMVEGIYLARLNGVPEEDQLTLDMVDTQAMEFDSEINAAAEKAEESDGHSVVANRLRSMSPRMAYAYDREIVKAKATNIPNLFTQASSVENGLTIIGKDGNTKDYSMLRDPADFAKWWETFEKLIYKQFTGVGYAVMNKDVFPVVEQLIGSESTRWSENIAKEQKNERTRINKNLVFDALRGRGNPESLMQLISTKTITRANLSTYILEAVQNGAVDGRTMKWLDEATFIHSATGKETTLAQELGSDWFKIQEAFSVKGQQQQQNRIADYRAAVLRAESELRNLGMQDENGLSSEVFDETRQKLYNEFGYMPDFSKLESEFGAKSVQEKELIEEYTAKAQAGQLTYNEFVRLPLSVQAKVKPAFEASGAFAAYQAREKHLTKIATLVAAPARKTFSLASDYTNGSVILKTADLQKQYKDLVAANMNPEQAYLQIVREFSAALAADDGDTKFFDSTNAVYTGFIPDGKTAKEARDAFNKRNQALLTGVTSYKNNPEDLTFFKSGFFSTQQLQDISDRLKVGEDPGYTPTMIEAAKLLDMSPLQMLRKFAENDTNLPPEFKMELPPPIQILDDSMSPAEKRFLNSISSFKAGSRVIARYTGASTLPTRQEVLEERQALIDVAGQLGIDPLDLATIIGFETSGTYDPSIVGGDSGNHVGLIQFGISERAAYGVTPGMSFADQLRGPVKKYLLDRFKGQNRSTNGATLLDLYRTVLGGNPNASLTGEDAFGTSPQSGVNRMGPHREAARRRYGF